MPDQRRRPDGREPRLRWLPVVLVAVTMLATVGGPAIGRGVLHASDTLQLHAPWAADAPHGFTPHNTATSDTVDATVPARIEWSRRARAGDLPLWSDLLAGGAPLASVPNASAFSPLSVAWYLLPAWYAPAATKLLEMAVAAWFTYLLARRLGTGPTAAGVAAVAFAGSGFQVVWTNWPHAHVAALAPALLWAVDRAIAGREDRAIAGRRAVDLAAIALVSASMWFEGFPAVTLWAHLLAGAYALVRAWPVAAGARGAGPAMARRLTVPLAGVLLGLAVAAVQLLPFAFRLGELDLAYRAEKVGGLPWRMIATMVVPDAFGNPAEKVFYGYLNYVEINAFAGAAVVVLALAGAVLGSRSGVPRRLRWFLLAGIVVCVGLVFVGGPPLAAFQRIPVVGQNSIGRLRGLLALVVALQAAVGLDALVRGVGGDRRRIVALAVALTAAGLASALLLGSVAGTADRAGQLAYFQRQLVLPAVAATVAVVLVLTATVVPRPSGRRAVAGLLGVVVVVEAVAVATAFLPRIDRDLYYPVTATHRFLAANLGADRFASDGYTMTPGTTLVYGLRSVTAHTLTPAPYADLLSAIDPEVFARNRTYPLFRPSADLPSAPVLDRMGATYFVADPATPVAGAVEPVGAATDVELVPAGGTLEVEVPAGPLRAVRLELREPLRPATRTWVAVEVVDSAGEVVARGRRRIHPRTEPGAFDVAFAATGDGPFADGPWRVRMAVEAEAGELGVGVSTPRTPAVSLVRPDDDGLTIVATEGSVIYRRDRALPRVRWADRAVVEDDPEARVDLLASGAVPADTVILSAEPAAGAGTGAADGDTELTVVDDGGDELEVRVTAASAGHLVVADTLQDGWVAEVDGAPVELLAADHAFVAVPVPAGEHTVSLRYAPRGWDAGVAITAAALAILAGTAVVGRRTRADATVAPR